jgi:AraC-like DNA-binding protein
MPEEIKVNLHPVNFIIISGVIQSVVLAVMLLAATPRSRGNRWMGLFLLICSLHFSWSLLIDSNLGDIFKPLFWIPYSYLLAVGPVMFFYTRTLTDRNFKAQSNAFLHFMPAVLEALTQCYLIFRSIQNNVPPHGIDGFVWFRVTQLTAAAISITLYGRRSLSLIATYEKAMAENFSNQKEITLAWLFRLIKYLRVLWCVWLLFEVSFVLFQKFQMHFLAVYAFLYILLAVLVYSTYWIGIQAFKKADWLSENIVLHTQPEKPNVYARLSKNDLTNYVDRLNQTMTSERLYLHETLSLRILADRVGLEPNLVSYVLNNELHKSFFDYVNEFRIEEIKRKMNEPAYRHIKIVEIAYESGFNSKATFNRVFKKITGKSPSDFMKEASK